MCGIYGCTTKDPFFVSKMIERCSHRGPDGSDLYYDDNITLGHNLLAITATPSTSTQPWRTPKGNVLVYNGEIFNYNELLERYKHLFTPTTTCDTELLAWGLDHKGIEFVKEIDSQHAFALWIPHTQELFLSRDHAGIKPLYYAMLPDRIAFASEQRALTPLLPSKHLDELAVSTYAYAGLNATSHCFLKGMHKVMPGQTLRIHNGTVTTAQLDLIVGTEDQPFDPLEFVDVLRTSIHQQCRGLRNLGVFLSGGLDSSIIALHAHELDPNLHTFTTRIDPCPRDKEDYNSDADVALEFAQLLGTNHTEVMHTTKDYLEYFEPASDCIEEPLYNPSVPMYMQANHAQAKAQRVVTLAGDMGDELCYGYPAYQKIIKMKFNTNRDIVAQWTHRLSKPPRITAPLSRDTVVDYLSMTTFKDLNTHSSIGAYMRMDQLGVCAEDYFRRNDRLAMHYGMEGRFPWASKRVMQYCMNLDMNTKTQGELKSIVKTAYKDLLPENIITKSKTGWTSPLEQWTRQNTPGVSAIHKRGASSWQGKAWPMGWQWRLFKEQHGLG